MRILFSFLFVVIFLFPQESEGNYPYYRFKDLNIKLRKPRYNRYIRPQLRNIVSDYYHLMKKVEPAETELISIRNRTQKMNDIWNEWTKKCVKSYQDNCLGLLRKLYKEARELDTTILTFQNQRLRLKNFGEKTILDTVLHLTNSLDKISNLNYTILHFIEETLMTNETNYHAASLARGKFTTLLHQMLVSSELIMPALISHQFRPVFDKVWYSFIKRLERQILHEDNPDFLLEYLGDLNMAWNDFHMKVAKSEIKLSKNELQVVQIMHNRWNSVLKVFLRN